MKKYFFIALNLWFILAKSQSTLKGIILDKDNLPVYGAGVAVLNPKDSSMIAGESADENGLFEIKNLAPKNYLIKIYSIGLATKFFNKPLVEGNNFLGKIILQSTDKELKTVEITAEAIAAQQKGDTSQYSANAFKVNKDATAEDLINKMPTISQNNGKMTAQGEDVKKVLVDGKPFFGDDPNAALKNLPAEAIDKVQIYDAQSDQSAFTGFNDGNTVKTINITTKPQFKDGWFGRLSAGYGYKNVWNGKANINYFKGARKLNILLNTNNVNEQNFGIDDLLGVVGTSASSGGGGGGGRRGGPRFNSESGISDFLVNNNNGITTTHAVGLNYGDKWKKAEVNFSYFFNYGNTNSQSTLNRIYYNTGNQNLQYGEKSNGNSINQNHRFNGRIDWKMDSANSLLIQPRLSLQFNKGNVTQSGTNQNDEGILSVLNNLSHSKLAAYSASLQLLYRHAMKLKGRTISFGFTPSYTINNGNNDLDYSIDNQVDSTLSYAYFQKGNLFSDNLKLEGNVIFTEPFKTKGQWQFSENISWTKNISDKKYNQVLSQNPVVEKLDSSLSNNFINEYLVQNFGVQFRHTEKKWNVNVGANAQGSILTNNQLFPFEATTKKIFYNILPSAMFQYSFDKNEQIRMHYRTSASPPSVSQLQQVINNSNPLFLSTGNPNLKQNFDNNLNIRYSKSNPKKNTSFFVYTGANYTYNYIASNTFIAATDTVFNNIALQKGAQISTYSNAKSYWNARAYTDYSFKVEKLKTRFSVGGGLNYSRSPSFINGATNFSNNGGARLNIGINSNISEKYDFSIRNGLSVNFIKNTITTSANSTYLSNNLYAKAQINPWKGLILFTEITHQYYFGLSKSINQNYLLWNAAVGYKFLKNKEAEVRFYVFDILNQNNNVSRTNTDTYYEDSRSNIIQRYFMLQFNYNLRYFPNKKKTDVGTNK